MHQPQQPQQQPQQHIFPHWFKLALCCLQAFLLIFAIALVSTLQFLLIQRKGALEIHRKEKRRLETTRTVVTNSKNFISTIAPSQETQYAHLWKEARRAGATTETATAAQAYWNQVVPYLKEWDAFLPSEDSDMLVSGSHLPPPSLHTYYALQEAARLGHAEAQYYMANALASGILPFSSSSKNMSVTVDMISPTNNHDTVQSYLYWQMAAMDGHVPSAVTLAYRNTDTCEIAMPYYEEAAHGIMDMLEMDKHSRARVQPPVDAHTLSEIFLKGAASQLSWSNQPDEPADALRYYHMRATADDVSAAHTLAQLHHYGLRGVTQNLTLALQYYEMAAALGHEESAGQAGKFYFWGMGLEWEERNYVKAQSLFQTGAPYGLEGCRARFRNAQLQKQRRVQLDDENVEQCDHPSLNGLGLLYLFGMPLLLKRDTEKAQKYFELARDMGNADASYNLAMMRLGWKTHFTTLDAVEDSQQSWPIVPSFLKDFRTNHQQPSKADTLVALHDLVTAANKGHILAKHRLATIYSHGVYTRNGSTIIAKDCNKALKHFSWIVNNASPHLSHHTRRAYKQYMSGNLEASLRNFLVAAEMGHENSQVNAAFLLEQGVCLSLNPQQCAEASLRLWKAAVQSNPEAALRVGDMYYYGRLRDANLKTPGPFGWLPYVLYPERYVLPLVQPILDRLFGKEMPQAQTADEQEDGMCEVGDDGTCVATTTESDDEVVQSDLEMAARYYRLAADVHKSARANFNLGFLYEWGLGVKQDFPLAKRHYDLAKSSPLGEADIAVKIALFAMNMHERIVKFFVAYREWNGANAGDGEVLQQEPIPMSPEDVDVGHPVPPGPPLGGPTTKTDVIIKHLLSWETIVIVILTALLWRMFQDRPTPRRNR